MATPSDTDSWESHKDRIIGLGERSFHKSYYPQLRQNLDRLERFHTLLDRTSDFVLLVALPEGTIADANAALGNLVGVPSVELIGRPFESLGFGDANACLEVLRDEIRSSGDLSRADSHAIVTAFATSTETLWLELSCRVAYLEQRYFGVMVGRDVTQRKRDHETVRALLAEKEALLDNALVGIALLRDRCVAACNRRLEEILGCAAGQLLGQSTRSWYVSDDSFSSVGEEAYQALSRGQNFIASLELVRADGTLFWAELSGRSIDPGKPEDGSIWVIDDITERKRAEDTARFLSYFDALTHLPNQTLLQDRLRQAIAFSHRDGTKVALMLIDLDRFKSINDAFGRSTGDRFLVEVAKRLTRSMRDTDTVSRQGGDEFVLLLTNIAEPDAIGTFLGELTANLNEPFLIDGKELTASISAGVAIYPEDGADFETLAKKAEMAMYRAKEGGRNTYRFFNDEMNDDAVEQLTMHAGLRRALDNEQFVLYYQPQIEIRSGRLIGAEALIRWQHPDLGLVSPGRFIPVAEETGLIVEIGHWVLHEACSEAAKWLAAGMGRPVVAVNLSALQFKRGNIEYAVESALATSGLPPDMLELELTESILIRETDNVLTTVKRLKAMGIKLSIDDFGTGYSSLSYLKRFEVDKLKIDQSFIRDLPSDAEDAAIVSAIIQMARSLGLRTTAEGVEREDVLDFLLRCGCDEAQGYYFKRPIPAAEFSSYLRSRASPAVPQCG